MSLKGTPFREAYRQVANNLERLKSTDPVKAIKERRHTGASGNLRLDRLAEQILKAKEQNQARRQKYEQTLSKLTETHRKESG